MTATDGLAKDGLAKDGPGIGAARAGLIAAPVCLPLIAGAIWLWAARGWLIVIDLSGIGTHAFCL